mmetsp:Transcript_12076/g.39664  ORF Transcript_12076/g.39664 Transcript_12076/m.39664 type:complete len:241 (+) Transcript_12076:63-785(+)
MTHGAGSWERRTIVHHGDGVQPIGREQRERVDERGPPVHLLQRPAEREQRLPYGPVEEGRVADPEVGQRAQVDQDLLGQEQVEQGGRAGGVANRQALQPVLLQHKSAVGHRVVHRRHQEAWRLGPLQPRQVPQVAALERSLRIAAAGSARAGSRHRPRRQRAVRKQDDVHQVGAREDVDKALQTRVPHRQAGGVVMRERGKRMLHRQIGIQRHHLAVCRQQLEDLVLLQQLHARRRAGPS